MSTSSVQKIYGELLSLDIAERFEIVRLAMDSLRKECTDVPPVRQRSLLELRGLGKETGTTEIGATGDFDATLHAWGGWKPDPTKTPKPGCLKGKIWIADDFDAPMEEFEEYV